MGYYYLLFVIVMLLSLNARDKKNNMTVILITITALIFIFWGFRVGFTMDYEAYQIDFSGTGTVERHEGETLYTAMTSYFSYRTALLFQTVMFCILMFICFRFYITRNYWWLGFAVLFLNIDFLIGFFSGYRSCFVTMAIFIALLLKLKVPKQWLGITLGAGVIFLSSKIHYSGLFLVPLVLMPNEPIKKRTLRVIKILAFIAIIIFLFSANVFNDYLTAYVQLYAEDALVYTEGKDISNYYFSPANIVSLAARVYMFYYTLSCLKERNTDYGNVFVGTTAIFFFLLLLPPIGLLARFFFYLLFPVLIGIITIVLNEHDQRKRWLFFLSLTIFLFLKYHVFVTAGYTDVMKYSNILF